MNLTAFELAPGSSGAMAVAQVWAGPAAYSSLTSDGALVLFEGGAAYRYASILLARVPAFD